MPKDQIQEESGIRGALAHRHIDEARLAAAFRTGSLDEAVLALEALLAEDRHRYEKAAAALETISVADEEVDRKWRAAQLRINEEYFGIVDWQRLLDELDAEGDKEKQILTEAASEKQAIRQKLPTSVVAAESPEDAAPLQIAADAAPLAEQPFDLMPAAPAPDLRPEPKRTLIERIERLVDQKRRELRAIHERKVALVNAHGEKLLRQTHDAAEAKKRQIEAARATGEAGRGSLAGALGHADPEVDIDRVEQERRAKIDATRELWNQSLGTLAAREKAVQAQFYHVVNQARSTTGMIEDSGLFVLPKELQLEFELADQKRAIAFLDKSEALLQNSDDVPEEELKRIRASILMIWDKHDDAGLRSKAVRALEKLIFSNLADRSKGKLISLLVKGLKTSAQMEAAGALEEIVGQQALYFRLSAEDAETIIDSMSSRSVPVRVAAILVAAKELFLEQNRRIPEFPEALSARMLHALLGAMANPENRGVFQRLGELGYVQTSGA